jgi:trimeric autotransporter adhesin
VKTGSTWLAKLKGPTLALGISVFPFSAQADSTSVSVFNAEAYTTGNSSSLLFPITRAGDTSYDVLLRYHTVDMTAVAGTNYTAAAGTLTLPAGVTSSSASVVIAADPTPGSGQKTFQFVIDSATGFGPAVDFASPQTLLPGWFPSFVSAADLNGDGKPDLIVANTGANLVAVMLNTTAPGSTTLSFATYQIFATGSNPDAVAVADINGDGRPDIVVANFADNTISVLLNTTTAGNSVPSFASAQSFDAGSNPTSIAVVDANTDGRPDVIVANQGDDAVSVLRNSTLIGSAVAEFAARQVFAVGSQPSSVVAANVNGDGRPDVVVSNYNDDTVSVLLNTTGAGATSFAFTTQQTFVTGANPAAVAAADINGDGTIDLIVANSGSDTIAVLLNETPPGALAAAFLPQQSFTSGTGPQSIMTRDLNGDGKSDLVVANYGDGTLSVLRNVTAARSSEVTFEQPETFDTQSAPVHVVLADLNSDGRDELVVANSDATI